jgi:hypothetical protein
VNFFYITNRIIEKMFMSMIDDQLSMVSPSVIYIDKLSNRKMVGKYFFLREYSVSVSIGKLLYLVDY